MRNLATSASTYTSLLLRTLRLLRLQHPTPPEDFGDGIGLSTTPTTPSQKSPSSPPRTLEASGVAKRPMHTVFFGGGTPPNCPPATSYASCRQPSTYSAASKAQKSPLKRIPTPSPAKTCRPSGRRLHPRLLRHAVRRPRGATGTRPHPHAVERAKVVAWAKEVGLQVSVDLIYGSPGRACSSGSKAFAPRFPTSRTIFPRTR